MSWPADGRLTKATDDPRGVTVVFLHHFGGKRSSTRRHQDLVLALGFDAYAYTLKRVDGDFAPFRADLIRAWADELRTVLDAIPGPKILFSLSFPSMAVACLLGERDRPDVRAWVCDGGPFQRVLRCMWNYFAQEAADESAWRRGAQTLASFVRVGGPMYGAHADRWISRLRPSLPILSLRAGRDQLVAADAIDRVFAANPRLRVTTAEFAESRHVAGVLTPEYAAVVGRFLERALTSPK